MRTTAVVSLLATVGLVAAAPSRPTGSRELDKRDPLLGLDINLLGCKLNFRLINGLCVPTCTGPTYLDVKKNQCVPCADPDAATCTSTAATSCTKLYLDGGKCVNCASDKFGDNATRTCKPCSAVDADAATCSSSAALSCKSLFLKQGKCVAASACGSSFYPDPSSKRCVACEDGDASACSPASTATACSTKYLQAGKCVSDSQCAPGTFADQSSHTCKSCSSVDADAKTCTATAATACNTKNLQSGKCVDQCADGTFADDARVCQPCTGDAATCDRDGAITCKTLALQQDRTCAACPADTTFQEGQICVTCNDRFPNSINCDSTKATSCDTGFKLSDEGTCPGFAYSLLPQQFFNDQIRYVGFNLGRAACNAACGGGANTATLGAGSVNLCYCAASTNYHFYADNQFYVSMGPGRCTQYANYGTPCVDVIMLDGVCSRASDGLDCDSIQY